MTALWVCSRYYNWICCKKKSSPLKSIWSFYNGEGHGITFFFKLHFPCRTASKIAVTTFEARGASASVAPEALVSFVDGGDKSEAPAAQVAVAVPTSWNKRHRQLQWWRHRHSWHWGGGASAFVAPRGTGVGDTEGSRVVGPNLTHCVAPDQ